MLAISNIGDEPGGTIFSRRDVVKMNSRARAKEEDYVAIPVGDEWAIGRVLFVSEHFNGVMLIETRGPFETPDARWDDGSELGQYYTSAVGFGKRAWKVVGNAEPTLEERGKLLRIVATAVWIQDTILREASQGDHDSIPHMGVSGFILAERRLTKRISELDPNCP